MTSQQQYLKMKTNMYKLHTTIKYYAKNCTKPYLMNKTRKYYKKNQVITP